MGRIRLDQLLTRRGMARSETEAQALIHAGEVELDGTRRLKPGQLVAADASVSLTAKPRWASRAGIKLEHAGGNERRVLPDRVPRDEGGRLGSLIGQGAHGRH